jgi:hypothetical protein
MSTGTVLAIVAAVLVAAAIAGALVLARETGGVRLKRRFGPEYERTLTRHDGDERATRQELSERVRKYGAIELRPLDPKSREQHATRWQAIQARFVDEPGAALAEADRLIGGLAAERGFPAPGSDEHFDALSVHHPHPVQGYRQAHALADVPAAGGRRATEDLRQALIAARGLFDELVAGGAESGSGAAPESEPVAEPVAPAEPPDESPAADDRPRRSPLGHRFATLTAVGGRKPR